MSRRQPGFRVQLFRQQVVASIPLRLQLGQTLPIYPILPCRLAPRSTLLRFLGLSCLLLLLLLGTGLGTPVPRLLLPLLGCLLLLGLPLPLVLLPPLRLLLAFVQSFLQIVLLLLLLFLDLDGSFRPPPPTPSPLPAPATASRHAPDRSCVSSANPNRLP